MKDALGVFGPACVLAALVPLPAHADVLQIDSSGAQWLSGPAAVPRTDPADEAAMLPLEAAVPGEAGAAFSFDPDDEAALTGAFGQGVLTTADPGAGPERWRQHVARLAAKYDISPALLEAVVWQESRWNEAARSHAGARGLAQLMPGTARTLGVDPNDPAANLEGGARYLRMQLDAFDGDLEKALAAYNAGPRRVRQAGGVPNIAETRAYVAAIMARLSEPVRR